MLESGRKPRVIGLRSLSGKSSMRGEGTGKSTYKKELRFDPLATPIPRPDYGALGPSFETGSLDRIETTPTIAIAAAMVTNETIINVEQHVRTTMPAQKRTTMPAQKVPTPTLMKMT